MKSGYDQFFKTARTVATNPGGVKFQKDMPSPQTRASRLKLDISKEDLLEQELRSRAGIRTKKRKKKSFPWKMTGVSFIGLMVALYGFQNYEKVERLVKNIEITMLGSAEAAESSPSKAEKPVAKADAKAPGKDAKAASAEEAQRDPAAENDTDHLQKLIDRKKELDAREEELNRVEQELQVQKADLEKRMKELEDMRTQISSVLQDRVKADDQKIDTLVQMYSNMKPPQAAKVFENIDEDLAVEILGRMKKKNAADIMNLLKPEKAEVFTEKFAGYKRK